MLGRAAVVASLALTSTHALNDEDGPAMFESYAKNTAGLDGIFVYTTEAAEDCGISMVNYGTRMLLDVDAVELKDNSGSDEAEEVPAPLLPIHPTSASPSRARRERVRAAGGAGW